MDLSKEEKQDKELMCTACNDIFTEPRILECMHTFCTACLESSYNESTKEITCSICTRPTKILDGITSLTRNFILQNVIDALKEISRTTEGISICGECEQDVATSFCCDCFVKYCASCTTHHLRSKQFKGHGIYEIDEVSRTALYQGRTKKCNTHNIYLRYFCEDCQISTCHDCTIGNLHNNHTYFLLDDIVLQNKNELHDFLEKINEKKRLVTKAVAQSQNVLEKMHEEKNNAINIIEETFRKIIEALNEKKHTAIKKIKDNFEANKKSLAHVKFDSIILEEWALFTEKVLDNRCHSDIMENYFNLRNQLVKIADVTLVERNSVVQKPDQTSLDSPIQQSDGPRKLNRNPNAKSKPRLSRRNRAKSMENLSNIEKVEKPKSRRSVSFFPKNNGLYESKKLNNRAKSDDHIMYEKTKLKLQYSQPYSHETTTFTSQSIEPKRKAPPLPIPPRISSMKTNNVSTPPTPPKRDVDSKQQYVISVSSKPKHLKRVPPPPPTTPPIPPPITPTESANSTELSMPIDATSSETLNNNQENIDLKHENNGNTTTTEKTNLNESNSSVDTENPRMLRRSSSTPPEKPVRKNSPARRKSSTPEPRPRFLAGIKFVNQKISVNDVILKLLIESLGESFKLGKKDTGLFYVEAAYGDALFEVSEEIVCQ